MNIKPVGYKTRRIEFCMPKYAHTQYHGKHNHEGTVAHRFLVELSYARESTKETLMTKLAKHINYVEAYDMENHTYSQGHSRTHTGNSKVVMYINGPTENYKEVEELLFELRHHIGMIVSPARHGEKSHVLFNVSEVQDYLVD